jgi:hypothetical protein
MRALHEFKETLTDGDFWLHAAAVLVGYKASDLINVGLAGKLGPVPARVQPFVGPAIVIAAAPFLGKKFGPYVAIGAALHVADTVLSMVGVPQYAVRGA